MNEDNKKIITVSYVIAGGIVYYLVHVLIQFLAGNFSTFATIGRQDWFVNGVPVLLGFITFASLQFNRKVVDFSDAVVVELRKVVWPSRKDTGMMTVVVIIVLIIAGLLVGLFDATWAFVINHLVNRS